MRTTCCISILTYTVNFRRHEIAGPTVDHASFVSEGPDVMKRSSLMKFMARSILHMALFVVRQLPSDVDARLDTDAFLGAFSYATEDGHRGVVGPWIDGPGWRQQHMDANSGPSVASAHNTASPVSQDEHVVGKYEEWEAFYRKYAGHIPYAVAVKKKVCPLEGWTVGERLGKISSLKYPKKKKAANNSPGANGGKGVRLLHRYIVLTFLTSSVYLFEFGFRRFQLGLLSYLTYTDKSPYDALF